MLDSLSPPPVWPQHGTPPERPPRSAPQISGVFTRADAAKHLDADLISFLRIASLFFPGITFGMFSSSLFQGMGKGMHALLWTLLRTLIFTVISAWVLVFMFNMGLDGIWWGLTIGNIIGSAVAFTWAYHHVNNLPQMVPSKGNIDTKKEI